MGREDKQLFFNLGKPVECLLRVEHVLGNRNNLVSKTECFLFSWGFHTTGQRHNQQRGKIRGPECPARDEMEKCGRVTVEGTVACGVQASLRRWHVHWADVKRHGSIWRKRGKQLMQRLWVGMSSRTWGAQRKPRWLVHKDTTHT